MFEGTQTEKKVVSFWLSDVTETGLYALKRRIEDELKVKLTQDDFLQGLLKYVLVHRSKTTK